VPLGDDAILSHRAAARYPISLVVPGLSHRYGRRAYSPEQLAAAGVFEPYDETHLWTADPPADDETGERLAFEFAAAYQAVARDGLAVTLPMVPPKAWTALHALERHLTDTEGGKVWKVTKLLDQLDRECEPIWSEPVLDLLKGAKVVRAVSNFPIGLLTPPGFDEPLATLVPVVQQPTTPLTQTVQQALAGRHSTDLSAGARVLVAECIPMTDDVGVASLRAFQLMRDMLAESDSKVVVEVVETVSTEEVRAAIERIRPDILILSAHGYFPTDGSASGIDIGGELSLGDDLGPVPHVVLLSACSTAVRGDSGPTVVDVLRRRGARAVLGAQVPVRVDRNVMLLGRLLVNLSEVYDSDVVGADNLLDLWHHVQTSNQVNDLVSTSDNLARWAHTPRPGMMPPIMEFMSGIGVEIPIRRGHNFADTVTRLLHVADQSGDRDQVVRWLPKRFVPEAAFYHFVGEPERVMLRPPPAALLPKAFAPPT
jgi:hypothetical protein